MIAKVVVHATGPGRVIEMCALCLTMTGEGGQCLYSKSHNQQGTRHDRIRNRSRKVRRAKILQDTLR